MQKSLRNSFVIMMLFISQMASAQQVISAEYFWDTDPGVGSATPIIALDGSLDEAIEDLFTSSVSIPTPGLHTFNIRVKGLDNTWSNLFSYVINVGSASLITRDVQVLQAEYFWDTDPGFGSASPLLALDGNLNEAIENLFDGNVSIPTIGLHTFNIRIKGLDNTWSNLFSYVINVGSPSLISRDLKVVQAEYYWDTDPGQGSATPILALDGSLDEAIENLFNGSLASPAAGLHTFNIRIKGIDGTWSSPFSYVVNVGLQTLISRDIQVTQAEYFWDTDPGQGNGAILLALDGSLDEAIEDLFDNSVSIPTTGLHTFNIRVKGFDNTWSTVFSYVINVGTPTLSTRDMKVIQAEYFWDVDPGLGSASPILALDGNLDEAIEDVFKNTLTSTSIGLHIFNLRVKGEDNNWSSTFKYVVDVLDSNSYSSFTENICSGSSYTVPSGDETYSVAGVYSDTIPNANGFDSIMTINLVLNSVSFSTINPSACGSYLSPEGNTYTLSGTYTDVISSVSGCDSTITINLTILPNTTATISVEACDSYTSPSGNYIWTSSGTYIDTIPNTMGCDSIITLNLTINNSVGSTQTVSACDSYLWSENGSIYAVSGSYQVILTSATGCDSIITLDLTIDYSYNNSTSITACDSYMWPANGITYTSSGVYMINTFTASGCDSILSLNLTIGTNTTAIQNVTTCDNYTWPLNGNTYSSTGSYTAIIPNSLGCDSIVTLNLTINSSTSGVSNIVNCGSYTWSANGNTYTSSGSYTATLTNSVGCDSLATLNLTISSGTSSTETLTVCNDYYWSATGQTYTNSGTYETTLIAQDGCDSTLILNLTVNLLTANLFQTDNILTASPSGGAYEWLNCTTGAPIVGEIGQEYIATTNGDYAVVVTLNGCSDTSNCVTVDNADISKFLMETINLYPNPTDGKFFIDLGELYPNVGIIVRDLSGRIISTNEYDQTTNIEMNLDQPAGLYLIEITSNEARGVFRIVKK